MIPDKATRDEWRTLAENTQLTSELGEYTPEEFTILLDAVDELEDTVARLREALAVHQDAKELNDFETAGDVEAKSTRILRSLIALVPIAYECDNVTSIRRCPSAAFPWGVAPEYWFISRQVITMDAPGLGWSREYIRHVKDQGFDVAYFDGFNNWSIHTPKQFTSPEAAYLEWREWKSRTEQHLKDIGPW